MFRLTAEEQAALEAVESFYTTDPDIETIIVALKRACIQSGAERCDTWIHDSSEEG